MKGRDTIIEIPIDPVLFRLGSFSLEWHGVFGAVAIIVAVLVAMSRYTVLSIPPERLTNLALWSVIGGIIGARLFHVIDYWAIYYSTHLLQILAITQGGLAIYGAVVGGFVGATIYLLWTRLPIAKLYDLGMPSVLIGLAIGRIGCTINGDAWGAPTGGNWGLVYTHTDDRLPAALLGVPTQPFPVYEIVWDVIVAAIVWKLAERFRLDGRVAILGMGLYAVGRFFLNYMREEQIIFAGMQQAQVISLIVIILAIPAYAFLTWRSAAGRETPPESPKDTVTS